MPGSTGRGNPVRTVTPDNPPGKTTCGCPLRRAENRLYVDAAVLMTAPDALVQDPGGQDGPAVAYLGKCAAFFQAKTRIPEGRSTDVRALLGQVRKAIVGRARPKQAPPCYGHWQVEEKLGRDRPVHGVPRRTHPPRRKARRHRPASRLPGGSLPPGGGAQAGAPPDRERLPGGGGVARDIRTFSPCGSSSPRNPRIASCW